MKYYYAVDGDDTGAVIEKNLLSDNIQLAGQFSSIIVKRLEQLKKFFENNGGKVVFCAGDSILVEMQEFIIIPKTLLCQEGFSFSVGISKSPSDCVLALKKAKGLGKNRVIELGCNSHES